MRGLFVVTKYGTRSPVYGVTFRACEHSVGMFERRGAALDAGFEHVATYGHGHE
jgi:hypothetical protein